jgi:hypothetical protein
MMMMMVMMTSVTRLGELQLATDESNKTVLYSLEGQSCVAVEKEGTTSSRTIRLWLALAMADPSSLPKMWLLRRRILCRAERQYLDGSVHAC